MPVTIWKDPRNATMDAAETFEVWIDPGTHPNSVTGIQEVGGDHRSPYPSLLELWTPGG